MSAVAIFEQPDYGELILEEDEVYLACDGVSDPGNLGTIIRSAENFGITGVIMGSETVDAFNPKTVQSAMGSLFRVPVFSMDLVQLNECADRRILVVGPGADSVSVLRETG